MTHGFIHWWEIPDSFGAHPMERMANYQRHLEIKEAEERGAQRERERAQLERTGK